jgi:8-oxo-dGTP diphosphatase
MTESGLRLRPAVRGFVVDPADRVLLVRFEFSDVGTVWATPGGGIEPGEDRHRALRRELDEEIGLTDPDVGPCLWIRTHRFRFGDGKYDGQRDHVYLVRCHAHDPVPGIGWERMNAEHVMELRWWTLEELAAADGRFAPPELPRLAASILREGPPTTPFEISYRS